MGDRDRKEKGADSLGGELDSKTRAGALPGAQVSNPGRAAEVAIHSV